MFTSCGIDGTDVKVPHVYNVYLLQLNTVKNTLYTACTIKLYY